MLHRKTHCFETAYFKLGHTCMHLYTCCVHVNMVHTHECVYTSIHYTYKSVPSPEDDPNDECSNDSSRYKDKEDNHDSNNGPCGWCCKGSYKTKRDTYVSVIRNNCKWQIVDELQLVFPHMTLWHTTHLVMMSSSATLLLKAVSDVVAFQLQSLLCVNYTKL